MDKYEFISRLENALSRLSTDERSAAVTYYKELFEDAGSNKEEELIRNLGTPEEIAENIICESGMVNVIDADYREESDKLKSDFQIDNSQNVMKKRDNTKIILIILIIILTFPLWIGFVAAAFGIFIAFIAVAFSLMIATGGVGIALLCAGAATVFVSIGSGLLLMGIGLICLGLLILVVIPIFKLVIKLAGKIINGAVNLIRSVFFEKEVAA